MIEHEKKIKLNESELHELIIESTRKILNELSPELVRRSYVKANNDLENNNQNGVDYDQNGKLVDFDYQRKKRQRQAKTFGQGVARDISLNPEFNSDAEYIQAYLQKLQSEVKDYTKQLNNYQGNETDKEYQMLLIRHKLAKDDYEHALAKIHGFNIRKTSNNAYEINTPYGGVYGDDKSSGLSGGGSTRPNDLKRRQALMNLPQGMVGYQQELNGTSDRAVNSLKRKQRNVQNLNDYYKNLEDYDNSQREKDKYNRLPFYKKWFAEKQLNIPKPQRPEWENDENGDYDGYFLHMNPEDYNAEIENAQKRQENQKQQRNKYLGRK